MTWSHGSLASLTVETLLARPTIAGRRVTACEDGRFRVELKKPCNDGTQAVLLTAAALTGRLLAATPKPGRPFLRYL